MKNFIKNGDFLDVVAAAPITAGSLQCVGDLVGVATTDATLGETYSLALSGVYRIYAPNLTSFSPGQVAYFSSSLGEMVDDMEPGVVAFGFIINSSSVDGDYAVVRLSQ